MTIFDVKLESVKKIGDADVTVGIGQTPDGEGPLIVTRTQDPNVTHPLRKKDVVQTIGTLHGAPFTTYVFQALAWKHDLKNQRQYCWQASEGILTRYSHDVVSFFKRLSKADVQAATTDYRRYMRARSARRRGLL